jgi:hypothetical protein
MLQVAQSGGELTSSGCRFEPSVSKPTASRLVFTILLNFHFYHLRTTIQFHSTGTRYNQARADPK